MTGKTAFVTGASGFIGVNLVKQLGEAGWSVIAMHRETSDLTYLRQFPATRVVATSETGRFLRMRSRTASMPSSTWPAT